MKYDFHIHDVIRVEYRVATDGPSFPRGYAQIEKEIRSPGGNGVIAACALAKWGASVLLTGNALGDDPHGQFAQSELAKVPNLTFEPTLEPDIVTPYAIFLRAGAHGVGALLSPSASKVVLQKQIQDSDVARFFFGDPTSFGEERGGVILRATSQDYEALLGTLEAVCVCYLSLLGDSVNNEEKDAFVSCVVEKYKASFGGLESLPSLEEIESSL